METHNPNDPSLKSWVESANQIDCHFPVQNLPFGVFSDNKNTLKRVGIAIGKQILDLSVIEKTKYLSVVEGTFSQPSLNAFMEMGASVWKETRNAISRILVQESRFFRENPVLLEKALVDSKDAKMHLPLEISEYTDFYSSREHATNVGAMFRDPSNALMPNWLHIPIAYNGRASTIVITDTEIRRPLGQIKLADQEKPIFDSCKKLDFELEMGAIVGTSSTIGQPINMEQAKGMIFGYVILNDWSARDIQVWENKPLGPFQSKAFATSISPWIVTQEALEPFLVDGPTQDPAPLPYLKQRGKANYDLHLKVLLKPENTNSQTIILETNFRYMYWSTPQQLTHHAVCGCRMRNGDLLGSGTISGPDRKSCGSLLELSWNGENPIKLENGEERSFLEDGDTLSMTGFCQGENYRVGFGEVSGKIKPPMDPSCF